MGFTAVPLVLCLIAAASLGAAVAWLVGRHVASQHAAKLAELHALVNGLQMAQSAQAGQIAGLESDIAALRLNGAQSSSYTVRDREIELDPDFDETKDWAV